MEDFIPPYHLADKLYPNGTITNHSEYECETHHRTNGVYCEGKFTELTGDEKFLRTESVSLRLTDEELLQHIMYKNIVSVAGGKVGCEAEAENQRSMLIAEYGSPSSQNKDTHEKSDLLGRYTTISTTTSIWVDESNNDDSAKLITSCERGKLTKTISLSSSKISQSRSKR